MCCIYRLSVGGIQHPAQGCAPRPFFWSPIMVFKKIVCIGSWFLIGHGVFEVAA